MIKWRKAMAVTAFGLVASLMPWMQNTAFAAVFSVSGTVRNNGVGVAGVPVAVFAIPDEDYLATLTSADEFLLRNLGTDTTATGGAWSLWFDSSTLPSNYVSGEGQIDVMAKSRANGLASDSIISLRPGGWNVVMAPIDIAEGGPDASTGAIPPCVNKWTDTCYGPFQTKAMDVLAKGLVDGVGSYFDSSTTSTTLGFAFRINAGAWAEGNGTFSSSSGSSITNGLEANAKDKRLYVQWRHRGWAHICPGFTKTISKPWKYVGRGNTATITHPNYTNCGGSYFNNDSYVRQSGNNQTYSAGFTFTSGVASIGLSSQAGYSTSAHLKYIFHATGNVCGNNANREAAPIVEASTF